MSGRGLAGLAGVRRVAVAVIVGTGAVLAAGLGLAAAQGPADQLVAQVGVALTHAGLSVGAGDLGGRHLHAQHVVNIIEGTRGEHFDGSKGNPGDGYGALTYAADAAAGLAEPASGWAANTRRYLEWARDEALRALGSRSLQASLEAMQRSLAFVSAALGRPDDRGPAGAALALAAAASEAAGPAMTEVTVEIEGFRFGDGNDLVIAAGTTVVWINRDQTPHTVSGGPLDSPTLQQGDRYRFTFTEAGTYEYICTIHPTMRQRIIVR